MDFGNLSQEQVDAIDAFQVADDALNGDGMKDYRAYDEALANLHESFGLVRFPDPSVWFGEANFRKPYIALRQFAEAFDVEGFHPVEEYEGPEPYDTY